MKKRNCRKTPEKIRQHETAVKIRKMTDAQISKMIDEIQSEGEKQIQRFFECLESLAGTRNGISTGTIYKLQKVAVKHGFLPESEKGG